MKSSTFSICKLYTFTSLTAIFWFLCIGKIIYKNIKKLQKTTNKVPWSSPFLYNLSLKASFSSHEYFTRPSVLAQPDLFLS